MLDSDGEKYLKAASENAADILKRDEGRECLSFTLLKKESWSLKYNLVWNYIFGFDLFPLKTAKMKLRDISKLKTNTACRSGRAETMRVPIGRCGRAPLTTPDL